MKFIIFLTSFLCFQASASERTKAYNLHNRITGVPPSDAVLNQMEQRIIAGDIESAADLAMQSPYFYNLVLKNWFKTWSNQEATSRVPLNDFVATLIGVVKDELPFRIVLFGDIIYTAQQNGLTAYSTANNQHYEELEASGSSLASVLTQRVQSNLNGIADSAGVLTTRAAGEAFYSAGTNRRVTRYTFMNFLCKDFEELHDINIPDYRVRRDVDRKPGGDSRTYRNKCLGCHAGQDALGGAFAYFDFVDGELKYTPGVVAEKINNDNLYSAGHITVDNSWLNLWATGQNASLEWSGPQSGAGVRSLGTMLSSSGAFPKCMAKKVYEKFCLNKVESSSDISIVNQLATEFTNSNFNMKVLIKKATSTCVGE